MRNNDRIPDLNRLLVPDDTAGDGVGLLDPAAGNSTVRCHFRDIQAAFLRELTDATCVVGCVAWLTDMKILRALADVHCTSLIVQKEDFLRPDSVGKESLRTAYSELRQPYPRWLLPHPICDLSLSGDPTWEPVRCVGNYNRSRSPAHPRMHHKFVVFCGVLAPDHEPNDAPSHISIFPYKVWTGSFNLTYVGGRSLENAVVIEEPSVVRAYYQEWAQVSCLSEPLDWHSDWAAPEHRIGS